MENPETLDEFVDRKRDELERFRQWYLRQQDRTKAEYPEVQLAGDWEQQFALFEPILL